MKNLICSHHSLHLRTLSGEVATHDILLFIDFRIVYHYLEHEPIHLCLWKWVSTLLFYRVLRSHDKERLIQRKSSIAYGHLALLHSLQ